MAFDFNKLLADPNFQQQMGRSGQIISNGGSVGEALNPAEAIRNAQAQAATMAMLKQMFPQLNAPVANAPAPSGAPAPMQNAQPYQLPQQADPLAPMKGLEPTPIGQEGPDSITKNTTADGVTYTVKAPSKQNLNTFGSRTPPEAVANNSAGSSPFFQALLG